MLPRKPKWLVLVFSLLAAVLVVTNVLLLLQNRRLKQELTRRPPAWRPSIGTIIPSIEGIGVGGKRVRVDLGVDSKDTFLFVFSPRCAVCKLTMPAWRELARSADPQLHRLIYINTGQTLPDDYLKEMQFGDDATVISALDPKAIVSLNIRVTPEVIKLNPNGKVEDAWLGLTTDDDLNSLKRALASGG